jgi:Protein of unknown function (DUF2950)
MFDERNTLHSLQNIATKVAAVAILAGGFACFPSRMAAQQPGEKTFSSAGKACHALLEALQAQDEAALLTILGPDAKEIVSSGDPAEDKQNRDEFVQKYKQMHRMVNEPDGKTILYIGAENWPTPIPLVHKGSEWYFDTAAGKQEILYRRIGRNELSVIQVCHELVDAEKEYYSQPHDGESARQYAGKLFSEPGKHNGLYWEARAGQPESPIGPMVAAAAVDGLPGDANQEPKPFQGYYFRILNGEKTSSGGKSYVVDGKMTGGFAVVAFPAEYRSSGVMTFIVDQDGVIYEKDLGPRTVVVAKKLARYSRDATWRQAD